MYGRQQMGRQIFLGADLMERGNLDDLDVGGRLLLKLIFKEWDGGNGPNVLA